MLKYDSLTDGKSILIFTHKESKLIQYIHKKKLISENCILIVHRGGGRVQIPDFVDAYMSAGVTESDNTVNRKHIPLTTRNFLINTSFYENSKNSKKPYDIVFSGRLVEIKRIDILIDALFLIDTINVNVLFILNTDQTPSKLLYYFNASVSSLLKKKNISIEIIMSSKLALNDRLNFTRDGVLNMLSLSKCYVHCTKHEGESRAIHEAVISGCKIFSLRYMTGGGNDYHKIFDYCLYDDPNDLALKLINYISSYNSETSLYDTDSILNLFSSDRSIQNFVYHINRLGFHVNLSDYKFDHDAWCDSLASHSLFSTVSPNLYIPKKHKLSYDCLVPTDLNNKPMGSNTIFLKKFTYVDNLKFFLYRFTQKFISR